ncbi:hypothetical protein FHG87_018279 [Trinorchestia longiramus]|nr:hypothetical protein FHG87_018279 [Trinorchestia longiramus]
MQVLPRRLLRIKVQSDRQRLWHFESRGDARELPKHDMRWFGVDNSHIFHGRNYHTTVVDVCEKMLLRSSPPRLAKWRFISLLAVTRNDINTDLSSASVNKLNIIVKKSRVYDMINLFI